jgi:poly-gamma-glutamate synthesis protein (capsule biosynthesis protein)
MIAADYNEARANADIVLFYPHAGGQFNVEPGLYTKRLVKKSAELGFDAVFAAHSHTTHRAEYVEGKPCFYSMGNVSMSPGTFYSVSECLPEYGVAAHLYVEDRCISKVTISLFKMVEENGDPMRIVPVDDLYSALSGDKRDKLVAEVASVFQRITGRTLPDCALQKEYDL